MVGEHVEGAQKFSMDAAKGRQDGRMKCHVLIRGRIGPTVLLHFGAGGVIQKQVRIIVARLTAACCSSSRASSRKFVNQGHIDHQIAFAWEIDVADLQVSLFAALAGSHVLGEGGEGGEEREGGECRRPGLSLELGVALIR